MGKLQRPHICPICQFIGFIDAVYLHIFEVHLHKSPPMKCGCGIVRATGKGMQRHQNKSMCHGPFLPADHGVSLETYMKPASQLETLKNARGKAKVVDHLEMRPDILDFNDWMLLNESTKLMSEQSCQTDLCEAENSILESLTKENEKLKEEIRNLKRINESLQMNSWNQIWACQMSQHYMALMIAGDSARMKCRHVLFYFLNHPKRYRAR